MKQKCSAQPGAKMVADMISKSVKTKSMNINKKKKLA